MKKKYFFIVLLTVFACSCAFAANWYDGQNISGFELRGIKKLSVSEIDNVVYPYRGNQFSDDVLKEIKQKLYAIDGVDYIEVEAKRDAEKNTLILSLKFYEFPFVGEVKFEGNSKVKSSTITEALTVIQAGSFANLEKGSVLESAKNQILSCYKQNGFEGTEVSASVEKDEKEGVSNVIFNINEGIQYCITEIAFEGNKGISESLLRKQISLKKKSIFQRGYLDKTKIDADCQAISQFYMNNGYIDVIVGDPLIEDVSTGKHDYREVKLTFKVNEGSLWYFGGMEFSGNTVFSDEEIKAAIGELETGSVINFKNVENAYTAVSDLYYNNGYITTQLPVEEERDDTTMSIKYFISIKESAQSHVEKINFSGLERTKEIVMRRELELKPGDVFSKTKFTTSAQNLFNTGLISDLDYEMNQGEEENGVVIDFKLTEGSTMDIQFGATFGGSATGFPISGFLAWSNKNFRGMGQDLSVSTSVSPSSQSLSLSFGDDWLFEKRWSNSFSFSFSHTLTEDEYQLGAGSEIYDGSSDAPAYPKPFTSYEDYIEKAGTDNSLFKKSDLMDYDLFSLSLGYSSGYTWIYDVGRLGISGGLSIGLNRAVYDPAFVPFRKVINEYGEGWKMSNKLSFSFQWDGRDYVSNTTKGYVGSITATTAGGLLGGISNYNKLSASFAGYLKIVDIPSSEGSVTPLMLCGSVSSSVILPQFDFYGKKVFTVDATQDEMLYIDGMTIARGHNFLSYQSLLVDNMLELSYQLVPGVIQAEAFASATYVKKYLNNSDAPEKTDGWYYGFGAGFKLKIQGFPLGFYFVKNAQFVDNKFKWNTHIDDFGDSGIHFVLAISTSLI